MNETNMLKRYLEYLRTSINPSRGISVSNVGDKLLGNIVTNCPNTIISIDEIKHDLNYYKVNTNIMSYEDFKKDISKDVRCG